MKTMRQRRYNILMDAGFISTEAMVLSKVPRKVPYMKDIINRREDLKARSKAKGLSYPEYERQIKEYYVVSGRVKRDKRGHRLLDVWAMFRDIEDKLEDALEILEEIYGDF